MPVISSAYQDLIGIIGVGLILIAYFMNTAKLIKREGRTFFVMNIFGAALACFASYLINYWPFVILEATWTLVSIYGLMRAMKIKVS